MFPFLFFFFCTSRGTQRVGVCNVSASTTLAQRVDSRQQCVQIRRRFAPGTGPRTPRTSCEGVRCIFSIVFSVSPRNRTSGVGPVAGTDLEGASLCLWNSDVFAADYSSSVTDDRHRAVILNYLFQQAIVHSVKLAG